MPQPFTPPVGFRRPVRAVFFDIDGTLMSIRHHCIPESTLEGIRLARAAGIRIILCTSRARQYLANVRQVPYDGLICLTGAHCVDAAGNDIHCEQMDDMDVLQTIRHVQREGMPYMGLAPDRLYVAQPDHPAVIGALAVGGLKPEDIPGGFTPFPDFTESSDDDAARAHALRILQVTAFFPSGETEDRFLSLMPHSHAQRWTQAFVDIVPRHVSKALGMDVMARHFGFDMSETVAFGDGANDIPMLEHAAVGVAMGNASDEVKHRADCVTADVDEDGVWKAMQVLCF